METLRRAGFEVAFDAPATRAAWRAVRAGAAAACGCDLCRNFAAQRAALVDSEWTELLERLGLDPERESDVVHLGRVARDRHRYAAGWAFAGRLLAAPQAGDDPGPLSFAADPARRPAGLGAGEALELRLEATLGWVLEVPEPA